MTVSDEASLISTDVERIELGQFQSKPKMQHAYGKIPCAFYVRKTYALYRIIVINCIKTHELSTIYTEYTFC